MAAPLSCALPEVDYIGMCFTIPGRLRPYFRENRDFLYDLPSLAAEVIQLWIKNAFDVHVPLIAVLHTFGEKLNFNPHVHILIAAGGLQKSNNTWIPTLSFDSAALAKLWQTIVMKYLQRAMGLGSFDCYSDLEQVEIGLKREALRPLWVIHVGSRMHKKSVLGYAARYAGRPPLAQSRLLHFDATNVEILTKDRKTKLVFPISVFVRNLAEHVPDHYRHGVRCFGLWSPRGKNQTFNSLFLSLGKSKPSPAKLPNWRDSIRQDFRRDPLITENGEELIWARRIPPNVHG